MSEPRYATNALGWFFHDAIIHPFTGALGAFGRLIRSYRVMALAHHIHNASAPSNDVMADYAEARYRAGCNESAANPHGKSTPDEQRYNREQACKVTGKPIGTWIPDDQVERILKDKGIQAWEGQEAARPQPPKVAEQLASMSKRAISAEITLDAFLESIEIVLEAREKHLLKKHLEDRHGILYSPENFRSSK